MEIIVLVLSIVAIIVSIPTLVIAVIALSKINGLERSTHSIQMIPMDVNRMASALHNKEIDLFSAWEPSVTEAFKEYPDFFNTYQKITNGYLYFSKTFVENNPQITDQLLAAVIRAINWLKKSTSS